MRIGKNYQMPHFTFNSVLRLIYQLFILYVKSKNYVSHTLIHKVYDTFFNRHSTSDKHESLLPILQIKNTAYHLR